MEPHVVVMSLDGARKQFDVLPYVATFAQASSAQAFAAIADGTGGHRGLVEHGG